MTAAVAALFFSCTLDPPKLALAATPVERDTVFVPQDDYSFEEYGVAFSTLPSKAPINFASHAQAKSHQDDVTEDYNGGKRACLTRKGTGAGMRKTRSLLC